ncbi:MAG TPA: hypothetical protein DEH78_31780 [Solibacterales bacterium]|nr:hypothetical protein [Bryobacterales bacterium]
MNAIQWNEPWREVREESERAGLERELAAEVGPQHPLWGLGARIIGRHSSQDDVVVSLAAGGYAIVHLVWHGHIDRFPREYPATTIYADQAELQAALDSDEFS